MDLFRVETCLNHKRGAPNKLCGVMGRFAQGRVGERGDPRFSLGFSAPHFCSMPQPPFALLESLCHSPAYQSLYVVLPLKRVNYLYKFAFL